jgi:ABC-type phosphate transport system substrate-binding protein
MLLFLHLICLGLAQEYKIVEKKTDEAVVEYVKNNAGAIGYVSSSANTSGVKVIKVVN